jgi:hypothetical protein
MMSVLGKNNHQLPLIGVITQTISQFTSSCTEKNMITHCTTSSGTLSWIHYWDVVMTVLGKINHPLPSIGVMPHNISHFTSSRMEKNMITHSTTSCATLSWI